jgi:hypothetical protein
MLTGRIISAHRDRPYFFIRTDNAKIFFAHWTSLLGGRAVFEQLRVGDRVTFEGQNGTPRANQRPRALNIKHHPSWSAAEGPAVLSSASLPQENEQ